MIAALNFHVDAGSVAARTGRDSSIRLRVYAETRPYPHYFFVFTGRCQSSIVICLARATVSFAAGTSFTTVEPAAMVAPAPTVIGATSTLLDPVCTSFSSLVRILFAPS